MKLKTLTAIFTLRIVEGMWIAALIINNVFLLHSCRSPSCTYVDVSSHGDYSLRGIMSYDIKLCTVMHCGWKFEIRYISMFYVYCTLVVSIILLLIIRLFYTKHFLANVRILLWWGTKRIHVQVVVEAHYY